MNDRYAAAVLSLALLLASATGAAAQAQNKDQQKCLNGLFKRGLKLSGTVLKEGTTCVKRTAKDSLPSGVTGQECLTADLKGKIAKAEGKLTETATDKCGMPSDDSFPDFGFDDAPATIEGHEDEMLAVFGDTFELDLDATLAASAAADPGGRCSAELPGALRKVDSSMEREVSGCVKAGLKASTLTSAAGIEACLDAIGTDAKGRVAKAVATAEGKLLSKCPSGDLSGIFPGLASICAAYATATDAAGIADCWRLRMACRVCRTINASHAVDRDCDEFDNGTVDGTCPRCGNTVVDAGEECDDGDVLDGDGCTATCTCEYCGDGAVNNNGPAAGCPVPAGPEECDDGPGNSDSAPDACRTDCQLPECGDGVTDTGETCDDGDSNVNDPCPDGPTGTCVTATCGDGFTCSHGTCTTGPGAGVEECDDDNASNTDACLNSCAIAECGDGFVRAGVENCDDSNMANGDCCSGACLYEPADSPCTGGGGDQCTAPGCDGAGTCEIRAANEGEECDDGVDCTNASECQSGTCTATGEAVLGAACEWLVVGRAGNATQVRSSGDVTTDGPWCGGDGYFGQNTVLGDDVVIVSADGGNVAMSFSTNVNADAANIITNNAIVEGESGGALPGIEPLSSVAAGQVFPKDPSPTYYDTTGTHPLVAECQDAQAALVSAITLLNDLDPDFNYGSTYAGLPSSSTPATITAQNVGSLNVFEFDDISGNADVTINLSGGGSADTVFVLRVAGKIDTFPRWHFNLLDSLVADNVLWYVQGAGGTKCNLSSENVGSGTLFCPDTKISMGLDSEWSGAVFGGGTNQILLGIGVDLTHVKFTGL